MIRFKQIVGVVKADPAVANVVGYVGTGNGGFIYIALKPLDERKDRSAGRSSTVFGPSSTGCRSRPRFCRQRRTCASAAEAATRSINTRSRRTTLQDLSHWGPILLAQMKKLPGLQDVNY